MPRGGRRAGTPGKAYSNRSDLNKNREPVRIPGQPYGAQAAQVRAQQSVPVGPSPTPQSVPRTSPGAVAPQPTGTPIVPLDAPTTRPNEPLTAGVDIGAGPGAPPEVNPDEAALAAWLPTLELMASQPGTTNALVNLTRRVRAAVAGL